MTLDEVGRLQKAWKATHGDKACHHNRMLDHLTGKNEEPTGKMVCRECGFIFPNQSNSPTISTPSH